MSHVQTVPPATTAPEMGDGPHSDGPELVGYARVSTRGQKDDSQIAELTAAGCHRIFVDHGVSGKLAQRPELDKCEAYLREGDVFVITRLSRAMRSLRHLLNLTHELLERGIGLKVLKQGIDTSTAQGRFMFHVIAAMDEFQRELIVENTMEGLAEAKRQGKKGGHPPGLTDEQAKMARTMLDQPGSNVSAVARALKVSRATVYRHLERLEQEAR